MKVMGEKMVQKIAVTVCCLCAFVNLITALPQPVAVTTNFPSLRRSNPKCPAIPLWKDIAPTIQVLAQKNVISDDLYRKIMKTLNELLKECDDKVMELKAVDTNHNLEEDLKAKDIEIVKDVDINETEVNEANRNYDLELITTEANKPENVELFKSLIEKLPPFIPIFKPKPPSSTKVNSTHNSNSGNSTLHLKAKNDSDLNRIVLHYTKTAKSKPGDNILEVKRVQNTEKKILTSTEITASMEVNTNPSPNEKYEHTESVSSTIIPGSNVIHFNSIRRPTLTPNSINTHIPLGYVPTIPIRNSPLQLVQKVSPTNKSPLQPVQNVSPTNKSPLQPIQNVSPTNKSPLQPVQNVSPTNELLLQPVQNVSPTSESLLQLFIQNVSPDIAIPKDAGNIIPFVNANCSPLWPNSPCSGSVPENTNSLSVVPIAENKQVISSSFLKKIVQFPSPCTNTITPMPQNLIAVNIACNGENKNTRENNEKSNVVFFKPEDVEVLNVFGDTLKKTKMTVLVPAYVSQIDV